MKTLKISFGIAAFAIAVIGALVTKANTQMETRYVQQTANSCQTITTTKTCDQIGAGCVHESTSQQLFLDPPNLSGPEPTKCQNALRN